MRRIALMAGGLLAVSAQGQDTTWARLRHAVLEHPHLQAARQGAGELFQDTGNAGTMPLPRLEVELSNLPATGARYGVGRAGLDLWLSQERTLRDVSRRQKALAGAQAARAALDTFTLRRELLGKARERYEAWLRERWRQVVLDSLVLQARSAVGLSEARLKAGRSGAEEVALSQAQAMGLVRELEASRAASGSAWDELARWFGAGEEPDAVLPAGELMGGPAGAWLDSLRLQRDQVVEERDADLAQAQAGPSVSGALGLLGAAGEGVGIGVRLSIPLPPWDRPSWEAGQARARARALGREKERLASSRTRERSLLEGRIAAARQDWEGWNAQVLPALERAQAAVSRLHASGAAGAIAVWQAGKDVAQARLEALGKLGRLRDLQREKLDLEGVEP